MNEKEKAVGWRVWIYESHAVQNFKDFDWVSFTFFFLPRNFLCNQMGLAWSWTLILVVEIIDYIA